MKRVLFLLTLCLSAVFAQNNRYEIKSAMIEYEISGSGSIMGVESSITGNASLYFKDFGNLEYSMDKSVQKVMGETEEDYNIVKIEGDKVLTVDLEEEVIYEQKLILDEETLSIKTNSNLISMGAKKIGSEKILGYQCDIWELGEERTWIHKTVPLKIEISSMGVTQIQEAKSIKFNVDVPNDKFKLPKYPVKKVEDILVEDQGETPELSPEQEKMMQDLMKSVDSAKERNR